MNDVLDYTYTHSQTQATTGYFSCEPPASLSLEAALQRLEACPLDDFLHLHCLRALGRLAPEALQELAASAYDAAADRFVRPALAALLLEGSLLQRGSLRLPEGFPADAPARLTEATPLIYLRAAALPDHALARQWSELFRENISEHHMLPCPEDVDLPGLYDAETISREQEVMTSASGLLARLRDAVAAENIPAWQRPPAEETFQKATEALASAGVLAGQEMRHQASLSPIALLRAWHIDMHVESGSDSAAVRHTLRGQATAYGRGLSVPQARASCSMEIVERCSAYVSISRQGGAVGQGEVLNRRSPLPLLRRSCAELRAEGRAFLPPEHLPLEAPVSPDTPLHWVPARDPQGNEVLVPAQAVFLFCNLAEPSLFLAAGSTGLAAGNTLEEAKVAALIEILERDAEATTPFRRQGCFTLCSRDAHLQALLDDYAARGIRLQFQDMSNESGFPVYQAFVMSRRGVVVRATGAGLCGARAVLSAMTETPWPYPYGDPTGPALAALPQRCLEDLPDYSLSSPAANLRLLESLLQQQGQQPLYVELTRADLDIPVVRAIVPHRELTAELDPFSRPSRRLMARYLAG